MTTSTTPPLDRTSNEYRLRARTRKALQLAALLRRQGCTADIATELTQEGWKVAAQIAEVRAPSQETIAMVIAMLQVSDRTAKISDPFEGLT